MGVLNRAAQGRSDETGDIFRAAKREPGGSVDVSDEQVETIAADLGSNFIRAGRKLPAPRVFLRALAEHDPV